MLFMVSISARAQSVYFNGSAEINITVCGGEENTVQIFLMFSFSTF